MTNWIEIAKVSDIKPLGARVAHVGTLTLAIFRTAKDDIYVTDNRCPHKGGPLSEGIVHGDEITCPMHNWTLSLKTGEAVGANQGCVRTFPVRVEGGSVYISLEGVEGLVAAAE